MPSFVESCLCKGVQPSGVVSRRRIARPEAVGKLLKDRSVARFIVAPDGYGKTHVAFEYASIIFAFEHTFWIRCSSPCFVRDLDAGSLSQQLKEGDNHVKLVVFDNVPYLDPQRVQLFSEVLDELLKDNCEVIVTCSPSSDNFDNEQIDRLLITQKDLLLEDVEVAVLEHADTPYANIPCIAWSPNRHSLLLDGICKEQLTPELFGPLFAMLIIQKGSIDSLRKLFPSHITSDTISFLAKNYSFLGIHETSNTFETYPFSIYEIATKLITRLNDLIFAQNSINTSIFMLKIVDILLLMGDGKRAYEVLKRCVDSGHLGEWLTKNAWNLLRANRSGDLIALTTTAFQGKKKPISLQVTLAWSYWILGCAQEAQAILRRLENSSQTTHAESISCQILSLCLAQHEEQTEDTLKLAQIIGDCATKFINNEWKPEETQIDESTEFAWELIALFLLDANLEMNISFDTYRLILQQVTQIQDTGTRLTYLKTCMFGCTLILTRSKAAKTSIAMQTPSYDAGLTRTTEDNSLMYQVFGDALKSYLDSAEHTGELEWILVLPDLQHFKNDKLAVLIHNLIPSSLARALAQASLSLCEQQHDIKRQAEETAQKKELFEQTHPDVYRIRKGSAPVLRRSSIPQLDVRMFGGLEIRIDGEIVDPRKFTRKRARTMTTALALNKGKEISKDMLCEIVWPSVSVDECRNSFYSVWGSLKKALTVEGSCPYLVRSQTGCSFDARYLTTDMEEFDATCSSLVFGGSDLGSWEDLYGKITTQFASELLPTEKESSYINDLRLRCKCRIVDGLIAASARMLKTGEHTGALWFSREALMRDDKREDVYISLMEAQIAAHQRGPALETYFKCRDFLTEDLGIDPSPRIIDLYRSIIEYEESF